MVGWRLNALVVVGVLSCASATMAETALIKASSTERILDAQLIAGSLTGQFLDGEGRPIDGAVVSLLSGGQTVAKTLTNRDGQYRFDNLRGGLYQLTLGDQRYTARLWDQRIAPPSSRSVLTIVRSDEVIRGQFGLGLASMTGVVGGVAGAAAGGTGFVVAGDAQEEAEEAMKENVKLREMIHHMMSP